MDSSYKNFPFIFHSQGIVARLVDDAPESPQQYQNLNSCEELAEGSFSQRLGSIILNSNGVIGQPTYSLDGAVNTLFKLSGLNGLAWRYAATSNGTMYRISGLNPGAFTPIATNLSGNPMWMVSAAPSSLLSTPYVFIADGTRMAKDNGTFTTPQQMGIHQPQFPTAAQSQVPDEIILDPSRSSSYTTSGIGSFSGNYPLDAVSLTFGVPATGIQAVVVGTTPNPIGLFQSLVISQGNPDEETVLVLLVTKTGFIANFTKTHAPGAVADMYGWSGTVSASGTGTVKHSFGGTPVTAWPTTLQQADYIGVWLYVADPTQVQSIQLAFDCGDGSFSQNYFYKVIAQGPLQNLLNTASTSSTAATTAATDALLNESLGLYGNSAGSIGQLNTGSGWTPFLFQLSDFAGAGNADFSDPVYNWQAINGYQVTIVANDNASPVLIEFGSLILFGGAGPDSFAGVGYDYIWTQYNANDGTESNPSIPVTDVNPPNATNFVYPRRQPVNVTLNLNTYGPNGQFQDTQVTHARLYRRGGTLGDNYRRVDQFPIDIVAAGNYVYQDTTSDADLQGADFVSFVNDVPVTSSLPDPVNTTLLNAINTTNQLVTVTPVSMVGISVRQQVDIGTPTAIENNFEVVIVIAVGAGSFTAFVQNTHAAGETVAATAVYGQPCTGMALAFNQMWFWGDPNNPSYLYWSAKNNVQAVGSASYVDVGSPDDAITAFIPYKGNAYVSTPKTGFQSVAPGSNANGSPTIYPTACRHGIVAPFGWFATEEAIFYQAIDGLRDFAGGASQYLTQNLEFIFQSVGTTPIVEADQSQLSQTVAAYWNNIGYFSYIGVDGNRHRLAGHQIYKRWRNDDADAQCLLLEVDTNTLLYGDSNGLIHIDRQNIGYDQGNNAGQLSVSPIPINLQTFYQNQGMPDVTKSYQELTLDINTAGQTLNVYLLFEDGQYSFLIGTVNTTIRQKVNFELNLGFGYEYYKVALQVTGSVTQQFYLYQCSIKALPLAKTRLNLDTFWLRFGQDGNMICKDSFWEYTSTTPITGKVFYDGSSTAFFTFTLPSTNGVRQRQRQRLPAVSFRMLRIILDSTSSFQVWGDESVCEIKPLCQGKGYEKMSIMPN